MADERKREAGPIFRFLADDHVRLDNLLAQACARHDRIDVAAFDEFRAGLLRHIAMEEKVLLPAARRIRGEALPIAERLRLDHGVLAALLVPTPTARIIETIRSILGPHNHLEEDPGGLYQTCDELAGAEAEELVARLRAQAEVRVSAYNDDPRVIPAICRTLERAGYVQEAKRLEAL
jgi:hypothetical protein